ncbi:MAG: hypothetical protein PHE58_04975 [Candidatus Omnitrophica bacterium]|nr:hypothetical protein [Candidatus Omnitrophota bacterium]
MKYLGMVVSGLLFLGAVLRIGYAQENPPVISWQAQLKDAKNDDQVFHALEILKDSCVKEHRYSEFIEILREEEKKNKVVSQFIPYYTALSRYLQLKYLEEKQSWDEYFAKGNDYREEIMVGAEKTAQVFPAKTAVSLYARLLLWQFHRDQQDAFHEEALDALLQNIQEYIKNSDDPQPLKDIADAFLAYGEKAKANDVYKLYVDKFIAKGGTEKEIRAIADGFYKEGNIDLSQILYDVYAERVIKNAGGNKEQAVEEITGIARLFFCKNDCLPFTEKLFDRVEKEYGKDSLQEQIVYERAFNLCRSRDFLKAKDMYLDLLKRFPETTHADEANFKLGMIYTYVLRDAKTGKFFFENQVKKDRAAFEQPVQDPAGVQRISPMTIASLYQLGLLSQWEEKNEKAKEYYAKLVTAAGLNFQDRVALTKERLNEIEGNKPLEYNLKTFMDLSLKEEDQSFDMSKADLRSSPCRSMKDKETSVSAVSVVPQSGCMQVEVQYLWSGNLGSAQPASETANFSTVYSQPGTTEINVVVVSSSGFIDRSFDLIDVE